MVQSLTRDVISRRPKLASPNIVFLKEECYWPESIGVDEEFEGKLVVGNLGDAGQCWLGLRYKGKDYPLKMNGQGTVPLDKNQKLVGTYTGTIREWLGELEEWKESKTIEQTFLTGFAEGGEWYITDTWTARTYVKVPGAGAAIPTWAWVAGGVGILGAVGLVLVTRK